MAIYHLQAQVIKRSAGKSSVAAAAYRSGEKILDERTGDTHDYRSKKGVEFSEILAPDNSPEWVKDRASLWNSVEQADKRADSQLAKEVLVALPSELSLEQNITLAKEYVKEAFVQKGMIADINIHMDNPQNPHAHIMLTMREVSELGFGLKQREWNNPKNLFEQRKLWEQLGNEFLAINGHEPNMCAESLEARGIDKEPQIHLGQAASALIEKGKIDGNEKILAYFDIARENGDKIIENPDIAVKEIAQKDSVFNEYKLAEYAHKNSASTEQYYAVLDAIKSSPELISIGKNDMAQECFSSVGVVKLEQSMLANANNLYEKNSHEASKGFISYEIKAFDKKAEENGFKLSGNQKQAIESVTSAGDLKVVVGYAGTGKSTIMGVAKNIWETAGYEVKGCALSGKAAEGLEEGAGIKSSTVDRLLLKIENGKESLNRRSILVVDEAGMLDTKRMEKLIKYVNGANGKIVLVGDDKQLQAIGNGGAFKGLARRFSPVVLDNIIRHNDKNNPERTKIMRDASLNLALGNTDKAISAYDKLGSIKFEDNSDACIKNLVKNYLNFANKNPAKSQIAMAHTREDTKNINEAIRRQKIDRGDISLGQEYDTENGKRFFSIGDRIYFLQNNDGIVLKTVHLEPYLALAKENSQLILMVKNQRQANFDIKKYNFVDHGYAATIHKSQGVTVDKAHLLLSKTFEQSLTYVGMTRHKEDMHVYAPVDVFKDICDIVKTVSRNGTKTIATDFAMKNDINVDDKTLDQSWFNFEKNRNVSLSFLHMKNNEVMNL